jgi:NADPH-dependent curcumin reductase
MKNLQIKLAARPQGLPKRSDWDIQKNDLAPLAAGDVLVKVTYISLDPAMRGWMSLGKSYIRPVDIGEVMRAGGVGEVVDSQNDTYKVGDKVTGSLGVQEFFHSVGGKGLTKINTKLAPLTTYLGTLGMVGMTAYFALLEVGQPKAGETVVVSGAAGAVGSIVGQIAKIKGCRVIGIAGGADKCAHLIQNLGFDVAIDYKNGDLKSQLRKACPDGIDVYFDNVGGETLDICLTMIRMRARIVICGAISQYNNTDRIKGPSNYLALLSARARMEGFVVFDYAARYGEAIAEMSGWIKEGRLKESFHIVEGIETFPESLLILYQGDKIGKLILKVANT